MKKRAANLFVISKPMHYLHVEEFCAKRKIPTQLCAILVCTKHHQEANNIPHIKAIAEPEKWATIQYIGYINYVLPPKNKRTITDKAKLPFLKLRSVRSFVRTVRTLATVHLERHLNIVAITDYVGRHHRHIAASVARQSDAKEIVLIDEGSSMHNFTAPLRLNPKAKMKASYFRNRFTSRDISGWCLKLLLGLQFHHPRKATLFTVYKNMEVAPHDSLEENTMSLVRTRIQTFSASNEVWFLGACYVEQGIAHQCAYLSILKDVRARHPLQIMKYYPHRGEAKSNLDAISKLGYDVCEMETAIEPWFVQGEKLPIAIAAIATSAVDNFTNMLRGQVPVHVFKPDESFFRRPCFKEICDSVIEGHVLHGYGSVHVHEINTIPRQTMTTKQVCSR